VQLKESIIIYPPRSSSYFFVFIRGDATRLGDGDEDDDMLNNDEARVHSVFAKE
jgi:hypothetical protein